jgi:glycine dehydrogenase
MPTSQSLPLPLSFVPRHNSTSDAELKEMVALTGFKSMDALIDATVPTSIRRKDGMPLGPVYNNGMTEGAFLDFFK